MDGQLRIGKAALKCDPTISSRSQSRICKRAPAGQPGCLGACATRGGSIKEVAVPKDDLLRVTMAAACGKTPPGSCTLRPPAR